MFKFIEKPVSLIFFSIYDMKINNLKCILKEKLAVKERDFHGADSN